MFFFRKRQKVGKQVSAQRINYGIDAANLLDGLTVVPPLEIHRSKTGIVIRLGGEPVSLPATAITTSTITACSGSTPGSGTASLTTLQYDTSANPVYFATGSPLTVFSPFNASIANGTRVVLRTNNGLWEVVNANCPP